MAKIAINVRFKLFGIHRWPNPCVDRVKFLDAPHTHMFGFRIKMPVTHTERDVEFFDFKAKVIEYVTNKYGTLPKLETCINFGDCSCETIALDILKKFNALEVEVQEDEQDSAVISSDS